MSNFIKFLQKLIKKTNNFLAFLKIFEKANLKFFNLKAVSQMLINLTQLVNKNTKLSSLRTKVSYTWKTLSKRNSFISIWTKLKEKFFK